MSTWCLSTGTYTYRARQRNCGLPPRATTDCSGMTGYPVNEGPSYMDIYELDWLDRDDFITWISHLNTVVEVRNRTRNGCPERRIAWQDQFFSRVSSSGVGAHMRMTASSTFKSYRRNSRSSQSPPPRRSPWHWLCSWSPDRWRPHGRPSGP